jgi:hypothetical protein
MRLRRRNLGGGGMDCLPGLVMEFEADLIASAGWRAVPHHAITVWRVPGALNKHDDAGPQFFRTLKRDSGS